MENIFGSVLKFMPLIFAAGFLVPVIAQATIALGLEPPFGLSALTFAMIIAGAWGLFAQIKGRWI